MKYIFFMFGLVWSLNTMAQNVSASDLDAAARSAKSGSVMFMQSQESQDYERERYEEQLRAKERYEIGRAHV